MCFNFININLIWGNPHCLLLNMFWYLDKFDRNSCVSPWIRQTEPLSHFPVEMGLKNKEFELQSI